MYQLIFSAVNVTSLVLWKTDSVIAYFNGITKHILVYNALYV